MVRKIFVVVDEAFQLRRQNREGNNTKIGGVSFPDGDNSWSKAKVRLSLRVLKGVGMESHWRIPPETKCPDSHFRKISLNAA